MDDYLRLKPEEYSEPDWTPPRLKYVHDWRAYIGEELRAIWPTFSEQQKLTIARNAQNLADNEVWD